MRAASAGSLRGLEAQQPFQLFQGEFRCLPERSRQALPGPELRQVHASPSKHVEKQRRVGGDHPWIQGQESRHFTNPGIAGEQRRLQQMTRGLLLGGDPPPCAAPAGRIPRRRPCRQGPGPPPPAGSNGMHHRRAVGPAVRMRRPFAPVASRNPTLPSPAAVPRHPPAPTRPQERRPAGFFSRAAPGSGGLPRDKGPSRAAWIRRIPATNRGHGRGRRPSGVRIPERPARPLAPPHPARR